MTDRFDAALDYLADLAGSAVGDKDRSKVREAVADVRAGLAAAHQEITRRGKTLDAEWALRQRLEALAAAWDDCPDHLVHSFVQRLRANLTEDQP